MLKRYTIITVLILAGAVFLSLSGNSEVADNAPQEEQESSCCSVSGKDNENDKPEGEVEKVEYSEEELRDKLTPEQFQVTQLCGTEAPFTGIYWDEKTPGIYKCVVCDQELFDSDTKYDSGSGWPSFFQPINKEHIKTEIDRSYGMIRIEAKCARCDAHLGHIFDDGPNPTGKRFCINSASLSLEERASDTDQESEPEGE